MPNTRLGLLLSLGLKGDTVEIGLFGEPAPELPAKQFVCTLSGPPLTGAWGWFGAAIRILLICTLTAPVDGLKIAVGLEKDVRGPEEYSKLTERSRAAHRSSCPIDPWGRE